MCDIHNAGGGDNYAGSLHWRVEHTGPARCNEAAPVPSSSLLEPASTAAAAALALVSGCGRACATAARHTLACPAGQQYS